jgi:hypothetical protein
MKNIITISLAIISFVSNGFAINKISFEPIKLNFYSIEKIDSNLYITANKGYIVKFNPITNELKKIKVFNKSAQILKIFKINNTFYTFNISGQMAFTNNYKDEWISMDISDIPFLSVEFWNDNFFIRTEKNIIKVNLSGEVISEYILNSPKLKRINEIYYPTYLNSIKVFNNKLYVETDSNKILIFSNELKLIDSIEIIKSAAIKAYDSLKYYGSHYRLIKTEAVLYAQIYWTTQKYNGYSILVKIDKNNNILVDTIVNSTFFFPKVINDTLYQFTFDKSFVDTNKFTFSDKIGTMNFKNLNYTNSYYRLFNDYYVSNNNLLIIGLGGIIQKNNLDDKSVQILNEQYWLSEDFRPIVMDNNQ